MKKIIMFFVAFITMQVSVSDVRFFSEEEFITYCAARKAANIIFDIFHKDSQGEIDDRRHWDVNPRYDRTHQGLFLEFYDNWPNVIRTPWGRWCIYGGAVWHKPLGISTKVYRDRQKEDILQQLPLQELVGFKERDLFGPLYKICFDDIPEATFAEPVPLIVNKENGGIYTQDHFEVIEKWSAMTAFWKKQQAEQ